MPQENTCSGGNPQKVPNVTIVYSSKVNGLDSDVVREVPFLELSALYQETVRAMADNNELGFFVFYFDSTGKQTGFSATISK